MTNSRRPLHVRWLGRVAYREALALQEGLFAHGVDQHLLLCEHPHVFTHGAGADLESNLRCDPFSVGAELVEVQRGGDITYHGPGQLVGYPILSLEPKHGDSGPADTRAYISALEQSLIDALVELGLAHVGRMGEFPGVWVEPAGTRPRKIAAIGVRVGNGSTQRRTMHGFALNVSTDLTYMREHIVPCGISEYAVTSLREEGIEASMREVADVVARNISARFASTITRADVAWDYEPDGSGLSMSARKPEWIRPKVNHTAQVLATKRTLRDLDLVTVCEEAGCPNLSECWSDGTATFMVLGDRCTRSCGFCLIDTRKPLDPDAHEPRRIAEAVERMGLDFAVLTMVARDDLNDGGMAHVAECVRAIRERTPGVLVETLVSDAKGTSALEVLFSERPDVFNHNVETVARLQRTVRPSAGYARSLAVLARGKERGLTTKSGFMVGLGETDDEVGELLCDLASVGIDIVTIGQYLRPSSSHLPVVRYVEPAQFAHYKEIGESLGIAHVESGPLTRSSYHAKEASRRSLPLTAV